MTDAQTLAQMWKGDPDLDRFWESHPYLLTDVRAYAIAYTAAETMANKGHGVKAQLLAARTALYEQGFRPALGAKAR